MIRKLEQLLKDTEIFLFHNWYNSNFESLVEEHVQRHIAILRRGTDPSGRYGLYWFLRSRYEEWYCPPYICDYSHLNSKSRERYFFLRLDVDEAIEQARDFS